MRVRYTGQANALFTPELIPGNIYKVYLNAEFKSKTKDYYGTIYWEDDAIIRIVLKDFPNYKGLFYHQKLGKKDFEIIDEKT